MIYKYFISTFFFIFAGCYVSNNKFDNIVHNNQLSIYKGNFPVLIVVSHDGQKNIDNIPIRKDSTENFNIKNDLYTRQIGQEVYSISSKDKKYIPYLIVNNIHRKYVDMNRSSQYAYESEFTKEIYHQFHSSIDSQINNLIETYGYAIIYDIHGFSSSNHDIVLSNRNNSTTSLKANDLLINNNNSFINELNKLNFKTSINDPFYGGFIIKNIFTKFGNYNTSSIQVEIGKDIRYDRHKRSIFIDSFINHLEIIGNDYNI